MRLMNHILCAFINRFIGVCFYYTLIYNKGLDEYIDDLRQVLDVVRNESLYTNLKKFDFCMKKIVFLGHVASAKRIEMDETKVKVIKEWSAPKTVCKVKRFHGLTSFYRRIVKDFSTITSPLIEIVKKTIGFK
jgi:hypothetical protein